MEQEYRVNDVVEILGTNIPRMIKEVKKEGDRYIYTLTTYEDEGDEILQAFKEELIFIPF